MKPFVLILIPVLGIVLCIFQQSRFQHARQDLNRMTQRETATASARVGYQRPTPSVSKNTGSGIGGEIKGQPREILAYFRSLQELTKQQKSGSGEATGGDEAMDRSNEERAKYFGMIASMNPAEMDQLVGLIQTDGTLDEAFREELTSVCIEVFGGTDPVRALDLMLRITELPGRENLMLQSFYKACTKDPRQAVKWYEEHSDLDDPLFSSPQFVQIYALAAVLTDPAGFFTSGVLATLEQSPESLDRFGRVAASELRNENDHIAFLDALRKAQRGAGASESVILDHIRSDYLDELGGRIGDWTFEDTTKLIDGQLTAEEKRAILDRIGGNAEIQEPARWADWLGEVDWDDTKSHPLRQFVMIWSMSDPRAVSEWLDTVANVELREGLVLEYANRVFDSDPDAAAKKVSQLSESPEKSNMMNRIMETWRAKDPAAAAAFSEEFGH